MNTHVQTNLVAPFFGRRKGSKMTTQKTTNSAAGWSPDVIGFAPTEVIPEALILQTSTVAGRVEGDAPAVRVIHVEDDTAGFIAEGANIDEADPALDETLVYTGKIAQLVRVSREQYAQHETAGLLSDSVRRAIVKAANRAYIAQAAPAGSDTTPPAGLLNVAGIHDGGTLGEDLDALADAVAHIETNDGQATHIIAAPDVWAALRKVKTGTGSNASLLGAGTDDITPRLLGVPVVTTPAVPAGELIVLDKTAVISAVGQLEVATSHDVYFTSDSVALRATWRFGQNVTNADRIVKLSLDE